MGLAMSLMIHNYMECKEKNKIISENSSTSTSYIELPGEILNKLDKKDKQIIFNNNING